MRLRTPNFPGNPKCRPCACPLCIRSFGTAQCELRAPSLKIGNPKVKPPERTGASQTASYKHWPFFLQPVTPAPLFVAPSEPRRRRASLLEHPQCGSRPLSGPWIDRNLYDGVMICELFQLWRVYLHSLRTRHGIKTSTHQRAQHIGARASFVVVDTARWAAAFHQTSL